MGQAFLEFDSPVQRRRAHTKNESYIAEMQVQLHFSFQHGLSEAVQVGNFSTYEMASYIMHRQVIAARVRPDVMQPATQVDGEATSAGTPPLPPLAYSRGAAAAHYFYHQCGPGGGMPRLMMVGGLPPRRPRDRIPVVVHGPAGRLPPSQCERRLPFSDDRRRSAYEGLLVPCRPVGQCRRSVGEC